MEPEKNITTAIKARKTVGIAEILEWIKDEKKKNELVPGYVRGDVENMYNRVAEILNGLTDLKDVIGKINL